MPKKKLPPEFKKVIEDNRRVRVSQSMVDQLNKNGQVKNREMFEKGEGSDEFQEAYRRFYNPKKAPVQRSSRPNSGSGGFRSREEALVNAKQSPKMSPLELKARMTKREVVKGAKGFMKKINILDGGEKNSSPKYRPADREADRKTKSGYRTAFEPQEITIKKKKKKTNLPRFDGSYK